MFFSNARLQTWHQTNSKQRRTTGHHPTKNGGPTTTTPNGQTGSKVPPVPPAKIPYPSTTKYDDYFNKVCQYVYQPGEANLAKKKLTDFFTEDGKKKDPLQAEEGVQPKTLIIKKYISLWESNYDSEIKGSIIKVFERKHLDKAELKEMGFSWTKDISETVSFEITSNAYTYEPNVAYVDFANNRIGGGALALGTGWVQEEILMAQSTFLPWLTEVPYSDRKKTALHWCPNISLRNLYKEPVVMQFKLPFKWDVNNYGHTGLNAVTKTTLETLFTKREPDGFNIYVIAMAAHDFKRFPPKNYGYSKVIIANMMYTATRGFFDAMAAMHADDKPLIIHTGNWGCGDFKNNERVVFAIQAVAAVAAHSALYNIVYEQNNGGKELPNLEFVYDAFSKKQKEAAEQALAWVKDHLFNITPMKFFYDDNRGAVQKLARKTDDDHRWKPKDSG